MVEGTIPRCPDLCPSDNSVFYLIRRPNITRTTMKRGRFPLPSIVELGVFVGTKQKAVPRAAYQEARQGEVMTEDRAQRNLPARDHSSGQVYLLITGGLIDDARHLSK